MSMSLLMVVQPLLDAGRQMAGGSANGQSESGSDSSPFQALLQGQIASRQPDKQVVSQPEGAGRDKVKEPDASTKNPSETKEAKPSEGSSAAGSEGASGAAAEEATAAGETDAAVLAQIMAAAVGAQVVPVEPMPGDDAAELAGDGRELLLATDADGDIGRKMRAGDRIEGLKSADAGEETGDEALFGKEVADAEADISAAAEKTAPRTEPVRTSASDQAAGRPVAEQPVVQNQAQTQQPQVLQGMQAQQVSQAQGAAATAQADPASSRIMQQLGTPQWNNAIGQRVLWMVGQEQQSASLTLNPPELGPVRVVVSVSNNNATANFFSSHPDVRHALEGSLPRLREMLEGAGIQLGQAQVGADSSGQQPGESSRSSGSGTAAYGADSDTAGEVTAAETPVRTTVSRGIVDTFA